MEKYSKWRDPGTGIAPFLPIVPPKTTPTGSSAILLPLKRFIIGPVLALVRIPLISLLVLLAALLNLVVPIAIIKGLLVAGLIRLILFLAGFYWIPTKVTSLKRNSPQSLSTLPASGDIIVANSSSYIDLALLQTRFNPIFTEVFSGTSKVSQVSLWNLFQTSGSIPTPAPTFLDNSTCTLAELVVECKINNLGPIVVFIEGTSTNGRGLLAPVEGLFENLPPDTGIFLTYIKYPETHFSPTLPVGTLGWHIWGLCTQLFNSAEIHILPSQEFHKFLSEQKKCLDSNQIITLLARISNLRRLTLGIQDKREFLSYYHSSKHLKRS